MLGRLGNALYWLGCIGAAFIAVFALAVAYNSEGFRQKDSGIVVLIILAFAFGAWLIGYACRYVLGGSTSTSVSPPPPLSPSTSWEETYAARIYEALPYSNEVGEGEITPEQLRIPPAARQRYDDKALFLRETICFVALASVAKEGTNLRPVLMAYTRLLCRKMEQRGIETDADTWAEYSFKEMEHMTQEPMDWAQKWLAEFRNNPNDSYMVYNFANHCHKLFGAYKHAIEHTNKKSGGG